MLEFRTWKSLIALVLSVCLCTGLIPEGIVGRPSLRAARAEESSAGTASSDGGWLYRIDDDGYAQILGYSDVTVTSLSIPASLGGAWVAGIGENAFADNAALQTVVIPSAVSLIAESAFPNHTSLTIRAKNGTAALDFAARRGFSASNTSEYDFFDDILDLSEIKASQFSLAGSTATIGAPYARMLAAGMKLFLPASGGYTNGLPLQIQSVSQSGDAAILTFSVLSFADTLKTYSVQNVELTPDYDHVIILADGFELDQTQTRGTAGGVINYARSFSVSAEIIDGLKISGSIATSLKYSVSLDYSWFQVERVSYTSTTTNAVAVKVSGTVPVKKDSTGPYSVAFARVPLVSPTLISAWAELSLVLSVSGEVSIEAKISTTENFSWTSSGGMTSSKTKNAKDVSINAAVSTEANLKIAISLEVGFSLTENIKAAEIYASIGVKYTFKNSEDYPYCGDLAEDAVFSVGVKIGILNSGSPKIAFNATLFSLKWNICSKHIETQPSFQILDKCTMLPKYTVTIAAGTEYSLTSFKVTEGEKLTSLTVPEREGYTFTGWFKDMLCTAPWDFANDTVVSDMTLYAGWILESQESSTPSPIDPSDTGSLQFLVYQIENKAVCITGFTGSPVSLTIPAFIEGYPVTSIGRKAFYDCDSLVSVRIPDSVSMIAARAFSLCDNLSSVILPVSWNSVRQYTTSYTSPFVDCPNLKTLAVPEGASHIPGYAFCGMANLRAISLPDSITSIDERAFSGCSSLRSVIIPASVSTIGLSAFQGCSSLKSIYMHSGTTNVGASAFSNCTSLETVALPDTLTFIGCNAFYNCDSLTNIRIPDSVGVIGSRAFMQCDNLSDVRLPVSWNSVLQNSQSYVSPFLECPKLVSIEIPEGAASIPGYAFRGVTSLRTVTLPDTITAIYHSAFSGCTAIESIVIPDGVTGIYASAFQDCTSLKRVYMNSTVTSIDSSAFAQCIVLESIALPDTLVSIGNSAFYNCDSLTYVRIPDSVTNIGSDAFSHCDALSRVTLSNSWSNVSYSYYTPFRDCPKLTSLVVPENVTFIPIYAFRGMSSLTSISLPQTMNALFQYAFEYCSSLTSLIIPPAVREIRAHCFDSCSSLRYVYAYSVNYDYVCSYFASLSSEIEVRLLPGELCPVSFVSNGGSAIPLTYAAVGSLLSSPTVPQRADYDFTGWYTDADCTNAWSFGSDCVPSGGLTLYAGWTYHPAGYTYEMDGYAAVITKYTGTSAALILPGTYNDMPVTALADFAIPAGVRSVHIPASIVHIGSQAFRWAENLTTITVDENNPVYCAVDGVLYTRDGTLACYPRGKASASFTPMAGTTAIGDHGIYDCDALKAIQLPDTMTTLNDNAIYGCDRLVQADFKADVSSIGTNALLGCASMRITGPLTAPVLAAWADTYYLSYNEYSVIYMENGELLGAVDARAGSLLGEPPAPENSEMTFYGWSSAEDGTALWDYAADTMPQADLTLHAVWRYDFAAEAVDGGVCLVSYTGSRTAIRVPESIDGTAVVSIADDAFPDTTVTLIGNKNSVAQAYAQEHGMPFVPLTYTATFVGNGGSHADVQTLCATDLLEQPRVVRTGYILTGWYTDSALSEAWDFASDEMPASDLTLYAGWERVDDTIGDIPFTFDRVEDSLVITGYTGESGAASIPESINGEAVTAIADYAFYGNSTLLQLTVPGTVRRIGNAAFAQSRLGSIVIGEGTLSIGAFAFSDCVELSSISLPDSVNDVGEAAFQNCTALTAVTLPDQLTVIPDSLLSGCMFLHSAVLPSALETIRASAFSGCAQLTSVELGDAVSDVAGDAFDGCLSLAEIHVAADNLYYSSRDGVLFSKDATRLLLYPQGKAESRYDLPGTVTAIAERAMAGSRLTTLVLNDALCTIGAHALRGSMSLGQIVFASDGQLHAIGEYAFNGCIALREIVFPDTLEQIGAYAFAMCNLSSVTLPARTAVGVHAFKANDALTIYGESGSYADSYAQNNGIRFVDLSTDIPVTDIALPGALTLCVGDEQPLIPELSPADTTETAVSWSSSDTSVVYVSDEGVISARYAGAAQITAQAKNGKRAVCTVTVRPRGEECTGIRLSASSMILLPGALQPLCANVLPAGCIDSSVTWDTSDAGVAVYMNGCVSALSCGTTVLTATTANGLNACCVVTVARPFGTPDLMLPANLRTIEAEAFFGLPVTTVRCPEGLQTIGTKAFGDCALLSQVYIPASVTDIETDAFEGCLSLTIYGTSGSAAEAFAARKGYLFVAE